MTIPEQEKWGWALLTYDRPRTLEEAEHDAFKLASLQSLLAGQEVSLPTAKAQLNDGAVVTELTRNSRPMRLLLALSEFDRGLAFLVQRLNDVWESMPLVLDRVHEAQERQTALARALLITSSLEPLYGTLYPDKETDVAAFEKRKRRALRFIWPPREKAWVASSLRPGLSYRDKTIRLLRPLQRELGWSEEDLVTEANNFHDLRIELAHRPVPAYRSNTRWLESTRLCNLGLAVALYHLWVAFGAKPEVAAKAAANYFNDWRTWTLPSAVDEPLEDRKKMRKKRAKRKR